MATGGYLDVNQGCSSISRQSPSVPRIHAAEVLISRMDVTIN